MYHITWKGFLAALILFVFCFSPPAELFLLYPTSCLGLFVNSILSSLVVNSLKVARSGLMSNCLVMFWLLLALFVCSSFWRSVILLLQERSYDAQYGKISLCHIRTAKVQISVRIRAIWPERRHIIQSTLVISDSTGLTETLRDIPASTYQSWESEENNKLNNHI